jgi:hypothetical protein
MIIQKCAGRSPTDCTACLASPLYCPPVLPPPPGLPRTTGHDVPGTGQHKIMEYIRWVKPH